jgi:hypothetical protein
MHPRFGVISMEDRYKQTLETFESIRNKTEDSFILFTDSSPTPIEKYKWDVIKSKVDLVLNLSDDPQVQQFNAHEQLKSFGENNLVLRSIGFLKSMYDFKTMNGRMFKLGARAKLQDNFNIRDYDNTQGKFIFKKRIASWMPSEVQARFGSTHILETRMFSWCISLVDEYELIVQNNFQLLNNGLDTEHCHFLNIPKDKLLEFDKTRDEELLKEIQVLSKQNLYKATVFAHTKIKEFAEEAFKNNPEIFNNPKAKSPIDYFHSTLIFSLFKKFDFGYAVLTFGVGDCPIAVINKDKTMSSLMNWLDVGEFGGGTRFITQAEIFHSESNPMPTRFNFQIFPDFSYIFLMTDGIYDPKFVVEANLEKDEKWVEFLADLEGNNPEKIKVNFNYENTEIEQELSKWMDFWSTGNHDDRTLAIIF